MRALTGLCANLEEGVREMAVELIGQACNIGDAEGLAALQDFLQAAPSATASVAALRAVVNRGQIKWIHTDLHGLKLICIDTHSFFIFRKWHFWIFLTCIL